MSLASLLFSQGGAGKSHILLTAPTPLLIAETEGRAHLYSKAFQTWDPKSGKYPEVAEDSVTVVSVGEPEDYTALLNAINTPDAPWATLGVDSYTVLAKQAEQRFVVAGTAKDPRQDYKPLLKHLEGELIVLKNIMGRADRKMSNVVFTAWQSPYAVEPFFPGSIGTSLSHFFDLSAHISIVFGDGAIGQSAHIAPTAGIAAKAPGAFYLKYGEKIANPNLTQLGQETGAK